MLTQSQLLAMPAQDYMNAQQSAFFKARLLELKLETQNNLELAKEAIARNQQEADELDRASLEEDNRHRMRMAERHYYLLRKIDNAFDRLAEGSYGYCQETGEPIGLARLLLRPTAELGIDAKTRREHLEKNFAKQRS